MVLSDKGFAEFLAEEIKKYKGVAVPVKAALSERMLVRQLHWKRLHPNPDDEFTDPAIGPKYSIVNKYVQMITLDKTLKPHSWDDPVMVQKMHPDGYMILNGHHRWAAAVLTDFRRIPVSIVNLTQETDIEEMLRQAQHNKRASLDLDEVVFCRDGDEPEKALPFPLSRMYPERIRKGIPALLHFFSVQGYDIWVYTSEYYSFDYIQAYFKRYSVRIDGVITGMNRQDAGYAAAAERTKKRMASQYTETIHIDRDMLLRTGRDVQDFEEYPLRADADNWAEEVVAAVRGFSRK